MVGRLGGEVIERLLVVIEDGIHAGEEGLLRVGAGNAEVEVFERTDLGDELEQEGQEAGTGAGALVAVAELLLVVGLVDAVNEFFRNDGGIGLLHLLAIVSDGDLGHLRQERAHGFAIGADGEVFLGEHLVEWDAIGVEEGALEDGLGYLEADEVVEGLRRIAPLHHLENVEAELGLQMRARVLVVGDDVAVALAQLGVLAGGGLVYRRVAVGVGGVVSEGAEGEGVLVWVLRFADEVGDEVAGADVVGHVGEQLAAEGVVADVLDDGAAVGVGVSLLDLIVGDGGIAAAKQGDDVGLPGEIDDLLVREDGIGVGGGRRKEEKQSES